MPPTPTTIASRTAVMAAPTPRYAENAFSKPPQHLLLRRRDGPAEPQHAAGRFRHLAGAAEEVRLELAPPLLGQGGGDRADVVRPRRQHLRRRPGGEPAVEHAVAGAAFLQPGLRRGGEHGLALLGVDVAVGPGDEHQRRQRQGRHRGALHAERHELVQYGVVGDAGRGGQRVLLGLGRVRVLQAAQQRFILLREEGFLQRALPVAQELLAHPVLHAASAGHTRRLSDDHTRPAAAPGGRAWVGPPSRPCRPRAAPNSLHTEMGRAGAMQGVAVVTGGGERDRRGVLPGLRRRRNAGRGSRSRRTGGSGGGGGRRAPLRGGRVRPGGAVGLRRADRGGDGAGGGAGEQRRRDPGAAPPVRARHDAVGRRGARGPARRLARLRAVRRADGEAAPRLHREHRLHRQPAFGAAARLRPGQGGRRRHDREPRRRVGSGGGAGQRRVAGLRPDPGLAGRDRRRPPRPLPPRRQRGAGPDGGHGRGGAGGVVPGRRSGLPPSPA